MLELGTFECRWPEIKCENGHEGATWRFNEISVDRCERRLQSPRAACMSLSGPPCFIRQRLPWGAELDQLIEAVIVSNHAALPNKLYAKAVVEALATQLKLKVPLLFYDARKTHLPFSAEGASASMRGWWRDERSLRSHEGRSAALPTTALIPRHASGVEEVPSIVKGTPCKNSHPQHCTDVGKCAAA